MRWAQAQCSPAGSAGAEGGNRARRRTALPRLPALSSVPQCQRVGLSSGRSAACARQETQTSGRPSQCEVAVLRLTTAFVPRSCGLRPRACLVYPSFQLASWSLEYRLLPGPIPGPPACLICVVLPTTTRSIVVPFCCRNRGSEMKATCLSSTVT